MKLFVLAILAICCLPFFGVGLYEAYKSNLEISDFICTNGTVVGNSYVKVTKDGDVSALYLPEVDFFLPTGEKIHFTDTIGSLPPDYKVGTRLDVIYEPANPHNARVNSWKRIWLAPLILMSVGLLPIVIGAIFLRRL